MLDEVTGKRIQLFVATIMCSRMTVTNLCLSKDYRQTHPEVTVLDPPDAIQHLHNHQSMLQYVADMNLFNSYGKVGVPRQLVIKKDTSSIVDAVNKAGLMLPLVAKPLVADGSAKSHELSLAYDQYSLQKLEPPLFLQEFVNHGVLFKVYIIGEAIKVLLQMMQIWTLVWLVCCPIQEFTPSHLLFFLDFACGPFLT
ncbi:Inositol-tetrakisphosphate 1-kinase 3 [Hibiscus syriacus]|uniref:inositol-1,3,4-trisphosphate 5/6-kinase n=1 Tax=Hibiscus syriacus TaxID=106335 RepID=A0A6A2WJQ4_HIBSY|nr:Inositol-tetrakisphosphate 1-kinase 3 [Hibiscus syriacus]